MAKSGMNIGADSTLVASAGSLARSMGPADMTKSLDSMLEERGELLDSIESNFKKAALAADIANGELQDTLDAFGVKLNNGDLSQPEREEMQAKMEDYRARMKAIPFGRKGKKQREDLMYEINREIKTAANRDAAVTDVLSTLQNNLYDPNQLGANYTNFLNQIAKNAAEEETDPGFSKTKNEKGETVYSYKFTNEAGEEETIEGTIFDIQKKINGTKKDYEFIKNQNESIFGWQEWATQHPNAKFDDVYNRISSDMETSFNSAPDKFKSVINHSMGWNDKSYVETLNDTSSPEFKNVIKILNDLNATEFDYDGDGDVDAQDFVNEENVNTMIKALTDPDASQRRVAHRAAAKFYADTEARKAFDFGVRDRAKDESSGSGEGGDSVSGHVGANMPGIGWVHAEKFGQMRAHIDRGEDFTGNYGSYKFDSESGLYTDDEGNELTRYEVADKEGADKGDPPSAFTWTSTSAKKLEIEEAADEGLVTQHSLRAQDGSADGSKVADQLNAMYNMRPEDGKGYYFQGGNWWVGNSKRLYLVNANGDLLKWNDVPDTERADDDPLNVNNLFDEGSYIYFDLEDANGLEAQAARINALFETDQFKFLVDDVVKVRRDAAASEGQTNPGSGTYD